MTAARKMHLIARAPNDGAHRLAWYIGHVSEPSAAIERIAAALISGPAIVDRLLCGELVPEDFLSRVLARETGGAVLPADWLRATSLGWGDAPPARASDTS